MQISMDLANKNVGLKAKIQIKKKNLSKENREFKHDVHGNVIPRA